MLMVNPAEQARSNRRHEKAIKEVGFDARHGSAKYRFTQEVERFVELTRQENYKDLDIYDWDGEIIAGTKFQNGIGHETLLLFYPDRHAVIEAGEQCYTDSYEDEEAVTIVRLLSPNIDKRTAHRQNGSPTVEYTEPDDPDMSRYQWHETDIQSRDLSPSQTQQVELMAEDLRRRSDKIELRRA